jgi:hypothetical protein
MRMRDGWEAEAGNWAALAGTPGRDTSHEEINLPALRALLPAPGRQTLDLAAVRGGSAGTCGRSATMSPGRRHADAGAAGGRLCVAIPHPVNSAGGFQGRTRMRRS